VEARVPVRVLVSLDGPGPAALLLPLREDGGPAGGEEAILDGALFPGAAGRAWARLLVNHPGGKEPLRLPLGDGAVLLETPGGLVANGALAPVFAARSPSLSPHRLLDLRVARVPDAAVEVPPGGFVRVLLAFPPGTDLRAAGGATVAGIRLLPRELPADRLRTALVDGRLAGLGDAARAEAPAGKAR
jgi:hypothetical protein